MESILVNFLNHGILPFVGRHHEGEILIDFWRETARASGLRAMLMIGEAGVGKSALVEAVAGRIAASGGVVVQGRLYTDSATAIVPLIVSALSRSPSAAPLLQTPPVESIGGLISAFSRLCSLRPTLLIIEDLHLAGHESLADLSALLDRLDDEPLSLLAVARPVHLPARPVLERYLTQEMELRGLEREEIREICASLLGGDPEAMVVNALAERTGGNAMALRSALRGAFRSGAMAAGREGGAIDEPGRFVAALDRNVSLLSEGMTAHLTSDEADAAHLLAPLGEIFSPDGATIMLGDGADDIIKRLLFKGLIYHPASALLPIKPWPNSTLLLPPLAFTHSLLHRHFVEKGGADPSRLVTLLAGEIPIYSILPFTLLSQAHRIEEPEIGAVSAAIDRALAVAHGLERTSDWELGVRAWECANHLLELYGDRLDENERKKAAVNIAHGRVMLIGRRGERDVKSWTDRMMSLTEELPESMSRYRLLAIADGYVSTARVDYNSCEPLRREADELLLRVPELRYDVAHVIYLRALLIGCRAAAHYALYPETVKRIERFEDDPDLPDAIRTESARLLGPLRLSQADTPETVAATIELLDKLDRIIDPDDAIFRWYRIEFFWGIGEYDRALASIDEDLPLIRAHSLHRAAINASILRVVLRTAIDGDAERVVEEMNALYRSTLPEWREHFMDVMGSYVMIVLGMIGRREIGLRVLESIWSEKSRRSPLVSLSILLQKDAMDGWEPIAERLSHYDNPLPLAVGLITGRTTPDQVIASLGTYLTEDPALVDRVWMRILFVSVLDLAERRGLDGGLRRQLDRDIGLYVIKALTFLRDRSLNIIMEYLLERFGSGLADEELEGWKKEVAEIRRRRGQTTGTPVKGKAILLDTMTVERPGGEVTRLRGAQLCTMLGLLVADRMLDSRLSSREFQAIAMGTDRDPDSARKGINFAVFRLREVIGSEAIITGGETPELNLDAVDVDILQLHDHMKQAERAMRDGALMRSVPEIVQALEIAGGRVPFPTLYDEFFESLRDDLDNRLRTLSLTIARSLIRAGDMPNAERLLILASRAMPDDEEIVDLLRDVLIATGKRAEAVRLGIRESQ